MLTMIMMMTKLTLGEPTLIKQRQEIDHATFRLKEHYFPNHDIEDKRMHFSKPL